MTGKSPTGWIVVGGLHLLNGSAPMAGTDPVILAAVADARGEHADNTVLLAWGALGSAQLTGRTIGTPTAFTGQAAGANLFPGMLAGEQLRSAAATVTGLADPLQPLVPVFYLRAVPEADALHVYTQIRFRAEDACFIRLTAQPLPSAGPESLDWLGEAVRLHAAQAIYLNNHQLY